MFQVYMDLIIIGGLFFFCFFFNSFVTFVFAQCKAWSPKQFATFHVKFPIYKNKGDWRMRTSLSKNAMTTNIFEIGGSRNADGEVMN